MTAVNYERLKQGDIVVRARRTIGHTVRGRYRGGGHYSVVLISKMVSILLYKTIQSGIVVRSFRFLEIFFYPSHA